MRAFLWIFALFMHIQIVDFPEAFSSGTAFIAAAQYLGVTYLVLSSTIRILKMSIKTTYLNSDFIFTVLWQVEQGRNNVLGKLDSNNPSSRVPRKESLCILQVEFRHSKYIFSITRLLNHSITVSGRATFWVGFPDILHIHRLGD